MLLTFSKIGITPPLSTHKGDIKNLSTNRRKDRLMKLDLSKIKPVVKQLPPRIVLYGPPKIGKTTFASELPSPLIIDVEGGSGALSVARIEKDEINSYGDVLDAVEALYTQDHAFQSVVIDSADWLETLVF